MTKRQLILLVILLLMLFAAFMGGYLVRQSEFASLPGLGLRSLVNSEEQESFTPLWEVYDILDEDYFDQPLDNDLLAEGAINGMLAVLKDPNTRYLSPSEEEGARLNQQGSFEGIGAEVTLVDGAIVIVAAYDGSPAANAGIKSGDILLKADDTVLSGMDLDKAADLVRGPAGTVVLLEIERDGTIFEVEVVRDKIRIPSVRGEVLAETIGYLRLSRFSETTTQDLEDNLELLLENDLVGLILDLRRNPGGDLSTVVDIADHFLSDGTILIERFGNGTETVFNADAVGLAQDIPLVVLIDEGSASASEVLAGAIQDRHRGILIGVDSFGKGTVQSWRGLSNDGGVRITIARWLTPNGKWIHNEGLVPDITVNLPEEGEGEFIDTQLQSAIDYLSRRLDEGEDLDS